jgi:hypothetical protein
LPFVATHLAKERHHTINIVWESPVVLIVCDPPAHFNWMKKRQNMPVCLHKMVLAQHNCSSSWGWWRHSKAVQLYTKYTLTSHPCFWLVDHNDY